MLCKKFFSFTALKGDDWVETFLISKQNIGWEQSILTKKKNIGWEQNILAHKKNNIGSERKKNIIYFCMFKKLSWLCWTDEPFVIDRFLSASYHKNWIIVSKLKKCEGHVSRYNLSVLAAFSNSFFSGRIQREFGSNVHLFWPWIGDSIVNFSSISL